MKLSAKAKEAIRKDFLNQVDNYLGEALQDLFNGTLEQLSVAQAIGTEEEEADGAFDAIQKYGESLMKRVSVAATAALEKE